MCILMVVAVGDTAHQPTGPYRESSPSNVADSLRHASTEASKAVVGVMIWLESCDGGDAGDVAPQLDESQVSV